MSFKLSTLNNILLGLIILINGYIVLTPFLPELIYQVKSHDPHGKAQLEQEVRHPLARPHQPNQVIIPSMLLKQPIFEGKDTYAELNKGVWRWPAGSTPDKGSNTILIGHRFTYTTPQGVFYLLDKVKIGDELSVLWNDKNYIYKVSEIKEILPTQTEILQPTKEPTLTLYTCTPIWWPKHRLVVVARLETKPQGRSI